MRVPSASNIAKKWARVTAERTVDYEQGVRNPQADWADETQAAEGRYEEGLKLSMAQKRFGKGVGAAGTAKQQKASIEKGVEEGRWSGGVRVAEPEMASGMDAVVRVMEGVKLPPKYPKGDPRNLERVKAVAMALSAMKRGK